MFLKFLTITYCGLFNGYTHDDLTFQKHHPTFSKATNLNIYNQKNAP